MNLTRTFESQIRRFNYEANESRIHRLSCKWNENYRVSARTVWSWMFQWSTRSVPGQRRHTNIHRCWQLVTLTLNANIDHNVRLSDIYIVNESLRFILQIYFSIELTDFSPD